jgi:hypothetical protein
MSLKYAAFESMASSKISIEGSSEISIEGSSEISIEGSSEISIEGSSETAKEIAFVSLISPSLNLKLNSIKAINNNRTVTVILHFFLFR